MLIVQTKGHLIGKGMEVEASPEALLKGAKPEDGGGVGTPGWTEGQRRLSVQFRGGAPRRDEWTGHQERCQGHLGEAKTQRCPSRHKVYGDVPSRNSPTFTELGTTMCLKSGKG